MVDSTPVELVCAGIRLRIYSSSDTDRAPASDLNSNMSDVTSQTSHNTTMKHLACQDYSYILLHVPGHYITKLWTKTQQEPKGTLKLQKSDLMR